MKRRACLALLLLAACQRPSAPAGAASAEPPTVFVDLAGSPRLPTQVESKANVLVFITSDCPIANSYAPEIQKIADEFAPHGIRFFLIHVDPDITRDQAKHHAEQFGYRIPILIDHEHVLVRRTGVTITPEVAVLTGDGRMPYRGRIDDLYPDLGTKRRAPRRRDLRRALEELLAGRPVTVARSQAVGCDLPEAR